MYRPFFIVILLFAALGCSPRYSEFTRYRDDGKIKPSVALMPFSNKTAIDLPWDITEELTDGVRKSLVKSGILYAAPPQSIAAATESTSSHDFSSPNLQFAKRFTPNEFVVLLELIDHKKVPYVRQKIKPVYPADGKISHVLSLTARVKVIDIRQETPSIVLQEIIRSNHLIPEALGKVTPEERPWGHRIYNFTPLGIAHARLERDIARRLEDYIMVAKSY